MLNEKNNTPLILQSAPVNKTNERKKPRNTVPRQPPKNALRKLSPDPRRKRYLRARAKDGPERINRQRHLQFVIKGSGRRFYPDHIFT